MVSKRDRDEIEEMMRNGLPHSIIVPVFLKRMKGLNISRSSAKETILLHQANHLKQVISVPDTDSDVKETRMKTVEFDDIHKLVTSLGYENIRKFPAQIKISDIVAVENAKTAREKVKNEHDSLRLAMAKFMSGILALNARRTIEENNRTGFSEGGTQYLREGDAGDRFESDSDEVLGGEQGQETSDS